MKLQIILWILLLSIYRINAQEYKPFQIFLSNDVCADYTWCLTEAGIHDAVAELINAYLNGYYRSGILTVSFSW